MISSCVRSPDRFRIEGDALNECRALAEAADCLRMQDQWGKANELITRFVVSAEKEADP